MKGKKMLGGFLVGATMFALTTPSVFAIEADYTGQTTDTTGQNLDTTYRTAEYVAPVEYYDIDISYNDLNWVFVYEGDITNPNDSVWVNSETYYLNTSGKEGDTLNEARKTLLDYDLDPAIAIDVTNNSGFDVDAQAKVVDKTNEEADYKYSAGLQLAVGDINNDFGTFQSETVNATVSNTSTKKFGVKPTATKFVNDVAGTVQVIGEVNLTFSKAS